MYGLKQAVLLVNQLLQDRWAPFGYYPAHHTPGLWLQKTRPIAFSLIVDDFAVKYVGKHHANYVANVLSKFQHDTPKQPQHTPSQYITPVYGAKTQYATQD
jgi:hypothetical protein